MKTFTLTIFTLTLCTQSFAAGLKYGTCSKLQNKVGYYGVESLKSRVEESAFQAFMSYKGSAHKEMNKTLRKFGDYLPVISPNKIINDIHSLDTIFEKLPRLPLDLFLFRGSTLNFNKNLPFANGEQIREWTYTSTTLNIDDAYKFAQPKNQNERGQLFVLYFAKKKAPKGIVICDTTDAEILLPRQTDFKIMDSVLLNEDTRITLSLVQVCSVGNNCEEEIRKDISKTWNDIKIDQINFR